MYNVACRKFNNKINKNINKTDGSQNLFFLSTLYLFSTASLGNLFEGMNIPSLSSLNRSRLCGTTKQALRWRLC